MAEERICASCGRANPIDQPRCINCGQRAQGVVLVAERTPTASAWWSGSSEHHGTIPPPPQVREEMQRAEAARLDEERRKTERERRSAEARERQARQVAVRQAAASSGVTSSKAPARGSVVAEKKAVDCLRCGAPFEATASGQGFSFCLLCGAEAAPPVQHHVEAQSAAPVTAATTPYTATYTGPVAASHVQSGLVASPPKSTRSPVGAAVFSFFLPGIGQCLNGQAAKGALLLLVYFLASTVFTFSPMGIAMLIVRGVAAGDAYRIAEKRRKGVAVRDGEWDLG